MQKLSSKERVDRALRGEEVDRPPFTFWYHFRLHKFPGERHAAATLDFHRRLRSGKWYELREDANPFPEQIRALEMIRDGLAGDAYFVETLFNPWNFAEKLSSAEEVQKLKAENPQALLDALDAISRSEVNHARRAIATGASGMFLAIGNAGNGILSQADYAKFSEPFDRMVLKAVGGLPLNTLHLHGDKVYLERFWKGWPTVAINYSTATTGVPMSTARAKYSGVLMGGLDEVHYRTLSAADLKKQWTTAQQQVGRGFILTPGCSVPNDSTDEELLRLPSVLGA